MAAEVETAAAAAAPAAEKKPKEVEQTAEPAADQNGKPAAAAAEANGGEAAKDAKGKRERPPPPPITDADYNEELLIKVHGKVVRPKRPDDTERNLAVQKLQAEIDKASARMKEIKALLDSRAQGRGAVPPEVQAIRDKLAQLRGEFDAVLLQKKRLMAQSDDKKTERDKLIAEQRSIRDSVRGPANLAALDEHIAKLEFQLTHESLTAAQEKALREKKERIERQDRPAVARLAGISAKIDECKAAADAVRAEASTLNARLDEIKALRDAEDAKLKAHREAQQEARGDVPALTQEKKDLWELISKLRDKQRELRDAFNGQWDEFKKADRAFKAWLVRDRVKRNEQRKVEYEERQQRRKAHEKANRPAKFAMEVLTCEQAISYLKQFLPESEASKKAAADAAAKKVASEDAPAPGMKLLSRKADPEEDAYFVGGGKKGKGAKKAEQKQKGAAEAAVKKLPTTLPLETMQTFMKLGLTAPKKNEDVPETIAALEEKKKEFEAKAAEAAAAAELEEEEEEEQADAAAHKEADAEAEAENVIEKEVDNAEAEVEAAAKEEKKEEAATEAAIEKAEDAAAAADAGKEEVAVVANKKVEEEEAPAKEEKKEEEKAAAKEEAAEAKAEANGEEKKEAAAEAAKADEE